MTADTYPLRVLLLTFAGWINVEQQRVIEYLVEERLRERLEVSRDRLDNHRLRATRAMPTSRPRTRRS